MVKLGLITVTIIAMIGLISAVVTAQNISIEITVKENYNAGETIKPQFSIISPTDVQSYYNFYIICEKFQVAEPKNELIILNANKTFFSSLDEMRVMNNTETQNCSVYLSLGEPFNVIKEKSFIIENLEAHLETPEIRNEGYETIDKKDNNIVYTGACNANNKCEKGENKQNCPQDCEEKDSFKYIFIISLAALLICAALVIITKIKRKK